MIPIMEELKIKAREKGLWNLFLSGQGGGGLTNLEVSRRRDKVHRHGSRGVKEDAS